MTPAIVTLLVALFELLAQALPPILQALRRSGELSDAQWEAFKARMDAAFQAPHWTPEDS